MTDTFTSPIRDRAIAYIRTYVPVGVGSILGWLLTTYTWLNDALHAAAKFFPSGVDWRTLLSTAATAAVIALYYWGARQIGKKYPAAEKWLLGSSATPKYTAKTGAHVLQAGE